MTVAIISKLEDSRVVNLKLSQDLKQLRFREGCDNHFSEVLTKEQVYELIKELICLHDKMK